MQSYFPCRLTFFWLWTTLKLGYEVPLEPSDLQPLPAEEQVYAGALTSPASPSRGAGIYWSPQISRLSQQRSRYML